MTDFTIPRPLPVVHSWVHSKAGASVLPFITQRRKISEFWRTDQQDVRLSFLYTSQHFRNEP